MLKHIVMFKMKGRDQAKALELKEKLEILPSRIAQIKSFTINLNISSVPNAFDLVLESDFNNETELQEYKDHYEHQRIISFILDISEQIAVVDYNY
jgi:hypothetical protein